MKTTKGQTTRGRIAAVALELLREKGSAGLTMRQVAVRSGLSLSNVQYHFKSREHLLIGITEHHITLCHGAMTQALTKAGGATLRALLEVSLLDDTVLEIAPSFRELFALARTEEGVHKRLMAYYRETFEQVVALLGTLAPSCPRERRDEIATLLMSALEGMYLLDDATPVSRERMVDQLEAITRWMLDCS